MEKSWSKIIEALDRKKLKDMSYGSGRILSSMCTLSDPTTKRIYASFLDTNLGDERLFPGTKEIENEVIGMLGKLLHNPCAGGFMTSGGTESNIVAVIAALKNQQLRPKGQSMNSRRPSVLRTKTHGVLTVQSRKVESQSSVCDLKTAVYNRLCNKKKSGCNIVVPESAHFSFDKIALFTGIKVKKARLKDYVVDLNDVKKKIDGGTFAIVGIAGTTEYGYIDPIEELGELATGEHISLHIDAAFGGFAIPFMSGMPKFDFEVEGVSSITLDPHKMGLAPIPAGAILFREKKHGAESIATPYLSMKRQFTLTGTRSGAPAAAAWGLLKHYGPRGYRKIVGECMANTLFLRSELEKMNFECIPPVLNILAFRMKGRDSEKIRDALWKMGWSVSLTRWGDLRIILMPHVTKKHICEFLKDLKSCLGSTP